MHFLTLAHRWLGVVLCLFFAAWFLSGAVLIYHPFPSLSQADRFTHSSKVDLSKVLIAPYEIVKSTGSVGIDRLRLINLLERPIYVLHGHDSDLKVVDAQNGEPVTSINKAIAKNLAEKFSGSSVLKVEGPLDYDQWIVPNRYDPYRPFYRLTLEDEEGTVLYVSSLTGEVLQKTTARQRVWSYLGAIIHWVYPTFLRSNWILWDQVVWWISLLGILTAVAGILLGTFKLSRKSEAGQTRISSPYKGWMYMHHILGLFVGVIVLSWIFSGWLSMDHGRIFSTPDPDENQILKYRALSMTETVEPVSLKALKAIDISSEVEFFATGGEPFVIVRSSIGSKIYSPSTPKSFSQINMDEKKIVEAVQKAWSGTKVLSTHRPTSTDIYGQLREGSLPTNSIRIILDDPEETWVHINMESGQIVSVMDKSRRIYRWLFNGLHSLDFPGLANNRPAWDIVILFLLLLGFGFSVTGVALGWKRLTNN